ncbi:MAG: hypothetical protein EOO38_17020 [Cytophagaceae bacterium]|nr:MAG: hypothetical protein EOO38_17020 [Cytophagaceae bacterium]
MHPMDNDGGQLTPGEMLVCRAVGAASAGLCGVLLEPTIRSSLYGAAFGVPVIVFTYAVVSLIARVFMGEQP